MNVYDKAHELKRAIMDSDEAKVYKEALERIKSNPSSMKMLDDFRNKQLEIQAVQMSGKEPDEEQIKHLEKLYSIISMNYEISRFLQCEYRLGVMMNDISKIMSEAIENNF